MNKQNEEGVQNLMAIENTISKTEQKVRTLEDQFFNLKKKFAVDLVSSDNEDEKESTNL